MPGNEQILFEELKKRIVAVMQQSYPGINPSMSEWKGQEITDFQEELLRQVNARISEKWFYTHMKSGPQPLPRIDVLNLLSRYAGYANWDDFVFRNRATEESRAAGDIPATGTTNSGSPEAEQPAAGGETASATAEERSAASAEAPGGPGLKTAPAQNRYFLLVPLAALLVVAVFFGIFKLFNTREYRFCFRDADSHEAITGSRIEVTLLPEGESPVTRTCGPDGCFSLKTDKSRVKMVVSSPYYQTDTIVRMVKKLDRNETVSLHANDYALALHYLSQQKVDDWEKRRATLDSMFDDRAMICQLIGTGDARGMEVFNKQEFIDRLTMPSGSLKNLEVLDTKYRDGRIMVLRFRVKTTK